MFSSHAHRRRDRAGAARRGGAAGLALAGLVLSLAACSGDAVRTLAVDAGYGPKTVPAPGFVVESHGRESPDFMAVGVDAPRRPVRAKSAEAQKALQAELEGARGRNEARGRAAEGAGKGTGKGMGKGMGKGTDKGLPGAAPAPAAQ